jgi:hypothetical protein
MGVYKLKDVPQFIACQLSDDEWKFWARGWKPEPDTPTDWWVVMVKPSEIACMSPEIFEKTYAPV